MDALERKAGKRVEAVDEEGSKARRRSARRSRPERANWETGIEVGGCRKSVTVARKEGLEDLRSTYLGDRSSLRSSQAFADEIRLVRRQVPLEHRPRQAPEEGFSGGRGSLGRGPYGELLERDLKLQYGAGPTPGGQTGDNLAPVVHRRRLGRVRCKRVDERVDETKDERPICKQLERKDAD